MHNFEFILYVNSFVSLPTESCILGIACKMFGVSGSSNISLIMGCFCCSGSCVYFSSYGSTSGKFYASELFVK